MQTQCPPPLPDECPAVSYEIEVSRRSGGLTVIAKMIHRMPDGTLRPGFGPMNYPDDRVSYVDEPCWLLRLLGDTTEARLERAKRRVAHRATREIAKQRRIEAAMKARA